MLQLVLYYGRKDFYIWNYLNFKIKLQTQKLLKGELKRICNRVDPVEQDDLALCGKALVTGEVYKVGFHEKLLEAFPVSYTANASWLQDGAAASRGHQQQWVAPLE